MVAAAGPACVSPAVLKALHLSHFRRLAATPSASQPREAPWWLLPPDPETVPGASGPAGFPPPSLAHSLSLAAPASLLPGWRPLTAAGVRRVEPKASGRGRAVADGSVDPAPDPWPGSQQLHGPEVAQSHLGTRPISRAVIPRWKVLFV